MIKKKRRSVPFTTICEERLKNEIMALKEKFHENQVEVAVNSIVVGIACIVGPRTSWDTAQECLDALPRIKHYLFTASDEEVNRLEYGARFYRDVRIFLRKNEAGIEAKFRYDGPAPSKEEMPSYLQAFSKLANQLVGFCLHQFRIEIEKKFQEEKEEQKAQDKILRLKHIQDLQNSLRRASGHNPISLRLPGISTHKKNHKNQENIAPANLSRSECSPSHKSSFK